MDLWQFEIRDLTGGAGTVYHFTGPITGLGIPVPRTDGDQERGDLDGDVGGSDTLPRRILTLPVGIDGADADDAMGLFQALKAAWRPSIVDVTLDLCLPGFPTDDETLTWFGRPRGIAEDLSRLKSGWIDALLTFEALDPYGYGAETTIALDGTDSFDIAGDAASDRWELDAVLAAVTSMSFSNADDDEPALALTWHHPAVGTVVLDGRGHNVTNGDLSPGYGWPVLIGGMANTLTLTGATGLLTYRPAFH